MLFVQLLSMGYDQADVETAVHIGENDPERVLNILEEGPQKYIFEVPYDIPYDKQQFFLYRWFFKPENKTLRLRITLGEEVFSIFRNSIRLRCTPLYNVLSLPFR